MSLVDSFLIPIVSNATSSTNGGVNNAQPANSIVYQIQGGKKLRPGRWFVGVTQYQYWATIPNISAAIGNNIIGISINSGSTYTNLTIPDGTYNTVGLNAVIQNEISGTLGAQYASLFVLSLFGNNATTQITLTQVSAGVYMGVDLRSSLGTLYQTLGFNANTYVAASSPTTFVGANNAQLQSPTTTVNISAQGLTDKMSTANASGQLGAQSIIFTTLNNSQSNSIVGENINPPLLIPLNMNRREIENFTINWLDQNGQLINFNQGFVNGQPNYQNNPTSVTLSFQCFV